MFSSIYITVKVWNLTRKTKPRKHPCHTHSCSRRCADYCLATLPTGLSALARSNREVLGGLVSLREGEKAAKPDCSGEAAAAPGEWAALQDVLRATQEQAPQSEGGSRLRQSCPLLPRAHLVCSLFWVSPALGREMQGQTGMLIPNVSLSVSDLCLWWTQQMAECFSLYS